VNISFENVVAGVPVTVMRLDGELDASNYQEVMNRANNLYQGGTSHLLLDLTDLSFLSSSGLIALHSVALTMRGEKPVDPETGWSAIHAMSHEMESQPGPQGNFGLLNPQPRVARTLEISGFSRVVPVFTDRDEALASFAAA
jgi:anti-anti-sigma regulatory factor